jgi:hypothetical protein
MIRAARPSPDWWRSCSGAVTGIGSLPLDDPAAAIDFVAAVCPRLPFCPQPPAVNLVEVTLGQFNELETGRLSTLERFARAAEAGAFPSALALKTQVPGPLTLAGLLGLHGDGERTVDRVTALASNVARMAAEQVCRLAAAELPVLVFVDEPALMMAHAAEAKRLLTIVFAAISAAGGLAGVHCCAAVTPGSPGALGSPVVSFDATADVVLDERDLAVLGDARRALSFGLVGVSGPTEPATDTFSRWLALAAQVDDPTDLARRSLLTPSCGLGGSTVAEAEDAFRTAAEVSELVASVSLDRSPAFSRARRPAAF